MLNIMSDNMMVEKSIITINQVNKTYQVGGQPLHALNNIQLNIKQGEYISLMGASGSGKSTLLNMIGLLDRPDSGQYQLLGSSTENLSEEKRALLRRQHIGFVFQSFHLIPRLSALENVELPLMLSEVSPEIRRKKAKKILAELGLEKHFQQYPKQLSGGQLQRVGIARALITEPRILLADEPTGNLDQASGREVTDILERYNNTGITLIVVTHDVSLGNRAIRKLSMLDGEIIKDINSLNSMESANETC
jgi:putative ABC transport system ATP-binding protein